MTRGEGVEIQGVNKERKSIIILGEGGKR